MTPVVYCSCLAPARALIGTTANGERSLCWVCFWAAIAALEAARVIPAGLWVQTFANPEELAIVMGQDVPRPPLRLVKGARRAE